MPLLDDGRIQTALANLDGWSRDGDAITRGFRFPDFAASMRFVNRVADLAEEADHHPDILVRYDRVTLTLSTHSAGGLTEKDVALAGRIQEVAEGED